MKLKDEKGNEFEFTNGLGILRASLVDIKTPTYGYLIPINPIPELEVGDWYLLSNGRLFEYEADAGDIDIELLRTRVIQEIRKANGTVWKK